MKDQKKILLILIALALSVATVFCLGSCLGGTSSSVNGGSSGGENGGDAFVPTELKLEYKQVAGGVEIYGVGSDSLKTELVIPATIDTYPVVGIAENAFKGFANIKHVTFEEGCRIEYIGTRAFDGCTSLESFVIPDTVETLGSYTFASCTKLEYLFIPISVETMGEYTVRGCDTAKLDVICAAGSKPSGWDSHYASNKNYDTGKHFEYWWGIERMEMSNPDLECCVDLDGELVMTDYYGKDINIVIPDTVSDLPLKHIYDGAFAGNPNVRSIVLPETLETLGASVFMDCTALRHVDLPRGLKSIGKRLFQGCSALDYVTIPNTVDNVGDFIFIGCNAEKLDVYCEIPTKPSTWSSYYASNNTNSSGTHFDIWWGTGAVEYSNENYKMGIKNDGTLIITHYLGKESAVEIPTAINGKNVTEIGSYAFYECSTVQTITIPNTVTHIREYAFAKCISLTEIKIPTSVVSLGNRVLANCNSLTKVYIPASVTEVGGFLFIGCNTSALTIYCEASGKPSSWNSYYASNNTNSSGTHFTFVWSGYTP